MALRWQQQHFSIHRDFLIVFRKHLIVEPQLLWRPTGGNVGTSLQQQKRPRLPDPPLLPLPPLLHPLPPSLPIPRSVLLPIASFHTLLRPRTPHLSSPMSSLTSDSNPNPNPNNSNTFPTKTHRVVIKGRVQGVFYRDWTVQNATELGLKGWVRNRRDGSVEALFCGLPEKVEEMEQRCRSGPPAAVVTGFEAFPSNDDPGNGFECRSTA